MNNPQKTLYQAGCEFRDEWLNLTSLIANRLRLAAICDKLTIVIGKATEWLDRRLNNGQSKKNT